MSQIFYQFATCGINKKLSRQFGAEWNELTVTGAEPNSLPILKKGYGETKSNLMRRGKNYVKILSCKLPNFQVQLK